MYLTKKILAVIPARGGSKRLPRKNILPLQGKPLVSWSIEEAQKSKYIDNIVLSSDDEEILNIAKQYDINYINRDKELSSDTATSIDVILDAIKKQNQEYDYIILLQPTSPLRKAQHIDEAIEFLFEKEANSVISMCEVEHPVQWNTNLSKDKSLDKFIKNLDTRRSQEQEVYYRLNGAIYISSSVLLKKEKTFFNENRSFAYIMDKIDSIDIDEKLDFLIAQTILKERTMRMLLK